jgi:hypothetical protein
MRLTLPLLLLPLAAAAGEPTMIQVDAVPLPRCLEQIAADTGARFIVSPQLAQDAPACRPVADAASAAQALDRALADSEVAWHLRDDGVYLLARADAQPAGQLDALNVEDTALEERSHASVDTPEAPHPLLADLAAQTRYDAPALAAMPLTRFNQLGRLAPNVYSSGQSLSIRGVPRDNDYFTGNGVFLDGIDVGTLLLDNNLIAVDELDSLRYVRGSSAFEYGSGAAGGNIQLRTPDPSPEFGARVLAGAGERNAHAFGASAGGALFDSGLSARVAIAQRDEPRFVRSAVNPALEGGIDRRDSANLKLLYEPEALPGLTLGFNGFHIEGDAPDRTVARPGVGVDFDIYDGISYDRSVLDWDLAATGRRADASYALAGGGTIAGWASDLRASRSGVAAQFADSRTVRDNREDRRHFGLNLAQPLGDHWRLYASVERQLLDSQAGNRLEAGAQLPNGAPYVETIDDMLQLANSAAAVELAYEAGNWRAYGGVRHVEEGVDFLVRRRLESTQSTPIDEITRRTTTDYSRSLPVGGIEYDLGSRHSVGITYGKAYRSGGFSEFVAVREYAPESLATWEAFWRAQWLDGRVTSRLSAFRTDWTDRTGIDGTIGAEIVEPFATRIDGAEMELDAELTESWSLHAGLGWLDSRHVRGAYRLFSEDFVLRGARATDAPRNTAILGAIWRGPGGWSAGIDAYHAGRAESSTFVADALNELVPLPREAYTVLDARLGWQGEHLGITLTASNLFDEKYIDRYVERRAYSRVIGEPRQVDLLLSWRF